MATIKSYTDIKQSKKLAEILPIKSADMHYFNYSNIAKPYIGFDANETKPEISNEVYEYVPCWSLAALLGVLPFIDFTMPQLIGTPKTLYVCMYNDDLRSYRYDNPIDAVYGMIIKLYEQNLI